MFQVTVSMACLQTYQFKIFPVGVSKNQIITVDFRIIRTEQGNVNRWFNLGLKDIGQFGTGWVLYGYISTYDQNQKLINLTPFDTSCAIGKNYSDTLDKVFQKGIKLIAGKFTDLEYFKPDYISFCDFQQECKLVSISSDLLLNKDYVVYEGKKYQIDLIKDTSYYGFRKHYKHPNSIIGVSINSIRIYKTNSLTLVITHLADGHELSMGWFTSDPKIAKKHNLTLTKEYKPDLVFTDITKTTYEEPLLHHGYGFDLFIVK